MWKFIKNAPISAVTNSQSVDQTVKVRIHFGTAGDLRSISVNLYDSLCSTSIILIHKFCDHCQDLIMKIFISFCIQ